VKEAQATLIIMEATSIVNFQITAEILDLIHINMEPDMSIIFINTPKSLPVLKSLQIKDMEEANLTLLYKG